MTYQSKVLNIHEEQLLIKTKYTKHLKELLDGLKKELQPLDDKLYELYLDSVVEDELDDNFRCLKDLDTVDDKIVYKNRKTKKMYDSPITSDKKRQKQSRSQVKKVDKQNKYIDNDSHYYDNNEDDNYDEYYDYYDDYYDDYDNYDYY